jgi:PAS domain S-box-containing protein
VALLENKVRLATAMDVAELVDWDYDVASGMFMFDDRFYALYGTTAEREGGNLMSAEVYMREFVYPEDRPAVLAALRKILATTDPAYTGQVEHRITPRDGSIRTIIARFVPVIGPEGRVIRTYGANQDITDRKMMEEEVRSLNRVLEQRVAERTDQLNTSLDEKVLLLREIHHRVKNNLQIVASLFNLQSRYIVDQTALESIRETQNRVRAMALVHERIYRSENVGSIDLNEYLTFLGEQVFRYYGVKSSQITLSLSISAIRLDIDTAIPLGLVINEMLSNSLKHGFPDGRKGTISIACCECDQEISLVFSDDGIGFPEGLNWKNPPSLGLRLIISLVRQLKGKVELDPSPGTTFRITAPLVHYAKHEETGSMLN